MLALAGCGGKQASAPPTTTAPAPPPQPTLTSDSDRATCAVLQTRIRLVSELVSSSVQFMTQSVHPRELAQRTGETQRNILLAAGSLDLMRVPRSLENARRQLVVGLQGFAADFGRAKKAVARNDMASAARALSDPRSLANVSAATKRINSLCGT